MPEGKTITESAAHVASTVAKFGFDVSEAVIVGVFSGEWNGGVGWTYVSLKNWSGKPDDIGGDVRTLFLLDELDLLSASMKIERSASVFSDELLNCEIAFVSNMLLLIVSKEWAVKNAESVVAKSDIEESPTIVLIGIVMDTFSSRLMYLAIKSLKSAIKSNSKKWQFEKEWHSFLIPTCAYCPTKVGKSILKIHNLIQVIICSGVID